MAAKTEFEDYPIAKYSVKIIQIVFPTWYYRKSNSGEKVLKLRIITATLIGIWLLLVLLGKGGFIHLFLLSAIGVGFVDAVGVYRTRMTA